MIAPIKIAITDVSPIVPAVFPISISLTLTLESPSFLMSASGVAPEQLIPSRLAKFGLRGQMDEFEKWHGLECIECGSCSFACPSRRQVAQPIKTMKKLVLAEKRKQASKK